MSEKIILLPDHVANQIAAGEVIQRPSSIVKELMENAIDAGATNIDLIVKDAGKTLVQVIDNGNGILHNDLPLAFQRHATSKIKTAEDLYEKFKNFGHHNEFEDSGMTLETIKEQIINREVKYNHYADKTVHDKHSFSYKLKKTNTEILPEYLQINSAKYKKWFS